MPSPVWRSGRQGRWMVPRPHPEPTGDGVHGEEGFVPSYGPVRSVERGSALSECCWAQGSGEQQQPKRCPAPLQTCSKCACTTLKLLSQVYLSVLMFSLRKRSPFQDVPAHSLRLAAPVSATTATRFGWVQRLLSSIWQCRRVVAVICREGILCHANSA